MIKDIGHYYIWANDKFRKVIAELTPEEFNHLNKVDRSIKELIIHMIAMFDACYVDDKDQIDVYLKVYEDLRTKNKDEILETWKNSDINFAKAVEEHYGEEFGGGPIDYGVTMTMPGLEKLVAYTDHSTFHRGQLLSALRLLGKQGISSDYYYYICEKNNTKYTLVDTRQLR